MALRLAPRARQCPAAIAAVVVLVLDLVVRVVVGGPYRGATVLLLLACGAVLLPLLPDELDRPALRLAVLPALALGSFTIVLTTISALGIEVTEASIRGAVSLFVLGAAALALAVGRPAVRERSSARREVAAVAAVLALGGVALAASWDVVGTFPPRGTDWGHYLLYAEEVDRQGALLIDDPLSGEEGQVFADPVMVGTLYGGMLILDGISSRSLAAGVSFASAASVLSVIAAAGGLWGLGAGLVAGGLYAAAPIRLDPMYWYGLGTALALVFLPLVILALGLIFRGRRDARTVVLLGLSLGWVAAAHSTTAVVVALTMVVAVAIDALRAVTRSRSGGAYLRRWWRDGAIGPLLAAGAVAAVFASGVVVHVLRQARRLGDPIDWRFFDPDWLTWGTLDEYLSAEYLLLGCASVVLLVVWRKSWRDPALLSVAAVLLASLAASQLWRLEISYEYRRAVFPFGLALAVLMGAALAKVSRWSTVGPVALVVCVYLAHETFGLRLPQRLVSETEPTSSAPEVLDSVRTRIERGELPDTKLVVGDQCLHFIVPYLLERPTISAFEKWQVAYESRIPAARRAATVIAGGLDGRRLATELGVGYVVVDPRCTPTPAPGLGGVVVAENDDIVVLRLPPS